METRCFGPPRPKAIATFLSSEDFLPGCQTVLHSVKKHLRTSNNQYAPEIIVLLSAKVKNPHVIIEQLCPVFCDRIIKVDHIPINPEDTDQNGVDDFRPSHVRAWDENCGWTKLQLFRLDSYDTILHIDADCLVTKDVSHLLEIGDKSVKPSKDGKTLEKQYGLLAAAPDIFPPDKFNAGVIVLRPSKKVFEKMMLSLPNSKLEGATPLTSYDGGDTGFLNAFYSDWIFSSDYIRLPFGCNAQRFMHHCTYEKQPKYWNQGIDELFIIHYSSSPKPWEKEKVDKSNGNEFMCSSDVVSIQKSRRGKLELRWDSAYESSQDFFWKQQASPEFKEHRKRTPTKAEVEAAQAKGNKTNQSKLVLKRFKQHRKEGMSTKDAMEAARQEFQFQDERNPSKAVGKLFGL